MGSRLANDLFRALPSAKKKTTYYLWADIPGVVARLPFCKTSDASIEDRENQWPYRESIHVLMERVLGGKACSLAGKEGCLYIALRGSLKDWWHMCIVCGISFLETTTGCLAELRIGQIRQKRPGFLWMFLALTNSQSVEIVTSGCFQSSFVLVLLPKEKHELKILLICKYWAQEGKATRVRWIT